MIKIQHAENNLDHFKDGESSVASMCSKLDSESRNHSYPVAFQILKCSSVFSKFKLGINTTTIALYYYDVYYTQLKTDMDQYQLEHIVGVRGNINGGICVINEKEIAYAAAHHAVIRNVETHSQRFIATGEITCMALSPSRDLIGIAEKGTGNVKWYECSTLRCKRKMTHESSSDILHISICRDSTTCLILSGQPDYLLTMWKMEKNTATAFASMNLAATIEKDVLRADLCPTNSTLVSIIGKKLLRMFHVTSKNTSRRFIPVTVNSKSEPQNYTSQCWLSSGDLIVGAENGEIIVIDSDRNTNKVSMRADQPIHSILECPKGFVVGCAGGTLVLYQQTSKEGGYTLSNTMNLCSNTVISGMGLMKVPSQAAMVMCVTEENSIIAVPLLSPQDNDSGAAVIVPSLNHSPSNSIHSLVPDAGALVLDVCVWRPLIAIGGYDDGTVRLYNYQSHELELTHRFDDNICDLSFSPCGDYILLSMTTTVCLCSVLSNKLNISWQVEQLPQSCLVRFSNGGDRFAICLGTIVQVHCVFTKENICTLRGHSKSIIDFSFLGYKDMLVTIGSDGVVCQWDINRGLPNSRCIDINSPAYLAGCVSCCNEYAYVMSADCMIKKINIEEGTIESEFQYGNIVKIMTQLPSGQIALSLEDGVVEFISFEKDCLIVQRFLHKGRVTSMQYSKDGAKRLFFAGKEGLVSMYKKTNNDALETLYRPIDGITMESREEFEEKERTILSLEDKIKSLHSEHLLAVESLNMNQNILQNKIQLEYDHKLALAQKDMGDVTTEGNDLIAQHTSDMEIIDKQHKILLANTREECEEKLNKEKASTEEFENRCNEMKVEFEAIMVELESSNSEIRSTATRIFHEQMAREKKKCDEIMECIHALHQHLEIQEEKMEEDAEREMALITFTHHAFIKDLKRNKQLLQQERSILQQRHNATTTDLRELQEQVASQEDKQNDYEETITKLDNAIESDHAEIVEQDNIILQKEHDMSAYSQANLEDEQINADLLGERRRIEDEIKPYEEEVKQVEIKLEQVCDQLREEESKTTNLRVEMDRLNLKLNQTRAAANCADRQRDEKEQLLMELESRLFSDSKPPITEVDGHQSLKASLRTLFDEFLDGKSSRKTTFTAKSANDKLNSVTKKISSMKRMMEQKKRTHEKEMNRLHREHAVLKEASILTCCCPFFSLKM